jgi:hypothetical protein
MADAWATKDWADRHFAEGLGFWEVNVYKAIYMWHPEHKNKLSHTTFRKMLAFTLITLGKAAYDPNEKDAAASSSGPVQYHELAMFRNYKGEHHQCDFCKTQAYHYCKTCFPDGKATHAICNPALHNGCYEKHVAGETPSHKCIVGIQKKKRTGPPERTSPRQAAAARAHARETDGGPTRRRL